MKIKEVGELTDLGRQVYEIEENYIPRNPRARATPIRFVKMDYECWHCISHTKSKHRRNYPVIGRYNRFLRMSRYVFWLENGHIDEEKYIMHQCDNPECINPNHLRLGSPQENTNDMIEKGRQKTRRRTTVVQTNRSAGGFYI